MSNNNNINSQNDIRSNKIGHPTQSQQQLTTQQQPLSDTREKEELLQGFLAKNRNTGRGNKNVNQQYQQQHQQQQQQQRTEYAKPQLNTSKPNPSLANQYSINDKNDINKSQAAQHLSSSASSAFSQTAAYSSKTPNVVTSSNLSQPKAHNLQPSSRNNPSVSSNVVMTPLASHTNNNFANSSTLANSAFQNPVTSVNPNFSNNRVQANQQRFDNRQHHQRIASGGQQSNPAAAAAAQQQQHHAQMMYGAQHGHPANIHVFPHGVYSSPMGLDPQGAPPMMDLVGGMAGRDNNMNFVNDGSFPMGHFQGFPMNLAPHQFGGMPSVSSSGVNKGLGGASMPGNAPGPYGLQFDSSALKGMNAGGFAPFDAYGGSAFYGKGGGKSGFDNSASSNIGGGAGSGAAHGQYGLGVMQAGASTQAAQMQQNQAQQHSFYPTAGNHGGVTMGAPVLAAGTANAAAGAAANVALSTKEYKSGNANYWSGN